ncbi:hypothetical protein PGTUg99_037436 [Puccinia graminis f. sp. tritici]|uniref:Secreted protein n=1 Tax=Puccinia graminis f. sp. tritici TaxID=56615 RepID=A0A5B0R9C1_PUCGR|nr:hypothetical protein PGTUg99_037436 [Puccinia graminis f. sp. tritici]
MQIMEFFPVLISVILLGTALEVKTKKPDAFKCDKNQKGPKAICILTPGGEQPSNYWVQLAESSPPTYNCNTLGASYQNVTGGCCLANFAVNSSPIKQIDVPTFNANCNFASKPKN